MKINTFKRLSTATVAKMLEQLDNRELLSLGIDPWYFYGKPVKYVRAHSTKCRTALAKALK